MSPKEVEVVTAWIKGLLLTALALASTVSPASRHLTIVGATSTLSYLRDAVAGFERTHPGYTVSLAGGGSVAGLVEVSRGRADVGVSDIPPRAEWTSGVRLQAVPLGRLPILFVVHPGTGVKHLTKTQLQAVLDGRVRSWKHVGGRRLPVVVMTRPLASGALSVVERQIMGSRRITARAIVELSNGATLAGVRETPGAVGFVESGSIPAGVTVLGVEGQRFAPIRGAEWPWYARPTLYVQPTAPSVVRDLVQYLAVHPDRARYGIYGGAS